ncbi:MAG TPA: diphthine--ammonia ligase [archaeon]|mgnify:CR=1 FL=1|jgi:asparagine synthase (glutamine-hydrolysing)|nr:diphthine--ammonia ligase [archaeon]HPV66313.1 diphthine--ammonia ligase [archaeon]
MTLQNKQEKLSWLLEKSIISLTKDKSKNYGLLFSGGIDSCLLALLLKKQKVKFTCFFAYVKNNTEPKDLAFAKKAAKELKLKLEIVSIDKKEIPNILPEIINITDNTSPVSVGVAIPIYLSCKKAKEKKTDVLLSGLGADELFAGYSRFTIQNQKQETKKCLDNIQKDNLDRDKAIAKYFKLAIKHPYLDKAVIDFALSLPSSLLISSKQNKIILREIAESLGLSKELVKRKKLACQYGSNSDKILEKLAKEKKYKTKTEYLSSFRKEKVGVLFSGGKDSNLSLWLAQKAGKEISCLLSMIPENVDSYMFQTPEVNFLKMQAFALDMPLLITKTKGEKEKELVDLKQAIVFAKAKFGLTGIVAGTLYSNYQKDRIEKICKELDLNLITPLWHVKEEEEIRLLLDNDFMFVICKIAAFGFSEKMLGKVIDYKDLEELKKLNKKYHTNIAGEGGEYETLVLDSPVFKKRISIIESQKIMKNEFTGNLIIKKIKLEKK